jgi:hypothetical protein
MKRFFCDLIHVNVLDFAGRYITKALHPSMEFFPVMAWPMNGCPEFTQDGFDYL